MLCIVYFPLISMHSSGRKRFLIQMLGLQHWTVLNLHNTQLPLFARLSTSSLSSLLSSKNERAFASVNSSIPSLSSSRKKLLPWHGGITTSIIARKAAMINMLDCMVANMVLPTNKAWEKITVYNLQTHSLWSNIQRSLPLSGAMCMYIYMLAFLGCIQIAVIHLGRVIIHGSVWSDE